MKGIVTSVIGLIGSWLAYLFGGWDTAMITLVIFMGVDFLTGLIVAGVFKKSRNSETGCLESKAGWKGLCRKGMIFLIILVAHQLDLVMESSFIKKAAIIAFIANETISIIENAGIMGIPIPKVIIQAIDILKKNDETAGKKMNQDMKDDTKK